MPFPLFKFLSQCFGGNRTARKPGVALSRRVVPKLDVLEDRSLPSAGHGPLPNILPHDVPAFVAGHDLGPVSKGHSHDHGHTVALPFKINGGGAAPDGLPVVPGLSGPHDATGKGTKLGKYSGEGDFTLDSLDLSTLTGTFHGTFTFVAKNCDKLVMNYSNGTVSLTPPDDEGKVVATFVADFTPVPDQSTGRFANVVGGSFVMVATSEPFVLSVSLEGFTPPFNYTWVGNGTLEFGRG